MKVPYTYNREIPGTDSSVHLYVCTKGDLMPLYNTGVAWIEKR